MREDQNLSSILVNLSGQKLHECGSQLVIQNSELVSHKILVLKDRSQFVIYTCELSVQKIKVHECGSKFMIHSCKLVWPKTSSS